jgi:F-type H+-transporting ATPase subunit delta
VIRTIAARYAKALMELAEEKKNISKTTSDLASFAAAVDTQPALQKLLASPIFTPEHKQSVIKELSKKLKLQPATVRFMEYLAETGRIRYVREVREAFEALLAERQNRAVARLTTAAAVSSRDLASIKKTLEKLTGKEVDLDVREDASLIGGAKAQIGSVIYDGTIKNQIDKMREKLVT